MSLFVPRLSFVILGLFKVIFIFGLTKAPFGDFYLDFLSKSKLCYIDFFLFWGADAAPGIFCQSDKKIEKKGPEEQAFSLLAM